MSSNYLVDDMYNGKTGRARRLIDEGDVEGLEAWCARNAKRVNESGKWPSWSMSPPDGDIPQNLLSYAAKYGHLEAMAVLLRHGADLDGLERESGPPLLYAAMGGQTEAIEALVRAGSVGPCKLCLGLPWSNAPLRRRGTGQARHGRVPPASRRVGRPSGRERLRRLRVHHETPA